MTTGQIARYKTGQIKNSQHHHDIGLTPHFKTLQSPQVPFSYGSVQRGLSAANKVAGLTSLGRAADKRYSLAGTPYPQMNPNTVHAIK